MSEPKRLHPIAAVLSGLKQLKELIVPYLVFVIFGSRGIGLDFLAWIGTLLLIVFLIVSGVIRWLRYTYRLEDGELRIEYGVIVRKKRYIPFERIQSLDFSENILHQLFGLVKVSVETAGSEGMEAEAVLTAITKRDALAIQEVLRRAKSERADAEEGVQNDTFETKETVIYKISSKELLLLASTSGGVGVVITAAIAFLLQFDELIPFEKIFKDVVDTAVNEVFLISIVIFLGFLLAWIAAVIGMMLKYAGFTLKRTDKDLIITRGLMEKKQITIPLKRIQGIRISENVLRQPLKLATVFLESAGGSTDERGGSVMILPLVKKERIRELLAPHLPAYQFNDDFTSAPKRALRRYIFRGMMFVIPILAVPVFFFKLWGLLGFLLVPFFISLSYMKYKDAGWRIGEEQLSLRYRTVGKQTVYMRKKNIQSLSWKVSYFQRKKNLSTIIAKAKSGLGVVEGHVVDLEKDDVAAIYKWYSRT